MPPRRLILGFLVRFALIFGLLIFPWPGWDEFYGQCFRSAGNTVFACHGEKIILSFEAHRETRGLVSADSRVVLVNRELTDANGKTPAAMLELNTRSIGWIPTALTIALILASPVPPRQLGYALFGGLLLVHAFIVLSVAIYIFNESTTVSLVNLTPFWKEITDGMEYTLITQLGVSFSIPVVIWIAVTFRMEDLRRFQGLLAPKKTRLAEGR